jgi:hypothetical protein
MTEREELLEKQLLDDRDIEFLFADILSLFNIMEMTIKNCACLENLSPIDSGYLVSIIRITKMKIMLLEKSWNTMDYNQDSDQPSSDEE